MAYTIKDDCEVCGSCEPQCPTGAIKLEETKKGYWIDPTLCDGCAEYEVPQWHDGM